MALVKVISRKNLTVFLTSLAFIAYTVNTSAYWLCTYDYHCANLLKSNTQPLLLVSVSGLLAMVLFAFLKKEIFTFWLYFFLSWASLYLFILYSSPNNNGGYIGMSSRTIYSIFGLCILGFVTIVIIAVKLFLLYRKK